MPSHLLPPALRNLLSSPRTAAIAVCRGALMVGVLCTGGLCLGRLAAGASTQPLLTIGAQVLRYAEASPGEPERALVLNGATLRLSVTETSVPVEAALDDLGLECEPGTTVVQGGDQDRGVATCAPDVGDIDGLLGAAGTDALPSRLRFAYAERRDSRTHVLRFWSEDVPAFDKLFPRHGDATGEDAAGLPRPAGARRLFSLHEVGQPYAVTLYSTNSGNIDAIRSDYERALAATGWAVVPGRAGESTPVESSALFATRGGVLAAVIPARESDGRTSVTVLTQAAGEAPR